MRPSVVITIAVLLLAILGAAALQFFILAPGDTSLDEQSGAGVTAAVVLDAAPERGSSTFVHL